MQLVYGIQVLYMCITARAAVSNFKNGMEPSRLYKPPGKKMLCTVKSNRATKVVQVRYSLIAPLHQEGARILEVLYSRWDTCSTSPVSAQRRFAARGALVQ